jgi:hypothetical protein
MVRRLVSTVALLACVGIYSLSAAERATFILSSGERISGDLAVRGADGATYVDGQLNLDAGGGTAQAFPIDSVAIIDLAGGTPEPIELSRVPEAGQCVVLRSGHSQAGKFVNIVRGDTLLWDYRGEQQQYPLRDVARVYLNAAAARTALRVIGAPTRAVATTGAAAAAQTALQPGALRVNANQAWNDTGIDVKAGDLVAFQASGQINFAEGNGLIAGPDGYSGGSLAATNPVAGMPLGGLIGKVGNGAPFPIGSNTQPIRMPAKGRLMLGVNDGQVSDNGGFFSVVVTKYSVSQLR